MIDFMAFIKVRFRVSASGFKELQSRFIRAREQTLVDAADILRYNFGLWLQTWDNKPDIITVYPTERTVVVGMNDPIARLLNFGREVSYERPDGEYIVKTIPGQIESVPGGGLPWVQTNKRRPGIRPRYVDETNAEISREPIEQIALVNYLSHFG